MHLQQLQQAAHARAVFLRERAAAAAVAQAGAVPIGRSAIAIASPIRLHLSHIQDQPHECQTALFLVHVAVMLLRQRSGVTRRRLGYLQA